MGFLKRTWVCPVCEKEFEDPDAYYRHLVKEHPSVAATTLGGKYRLIQISSFIDGMALATGVLGLGMAVRLGVWASAALAVVLIVLATVSEVQSYRLERRYKVYLLELVKSVRRGGIEREGV